MMWNKSIRVCLAAAALIVLLPGRPAAQRQAPASPATPSDQTQPTTVPPSPREAWEREFGRRHFWRSGPSFRLGQDYTLRFGETAREVAVVLGNAHINGRVEGDLVVLFGNTTLGPTAVIEGSFLQISGQADIARGALVGWDVVSVGATIDAPTDVAFAREQIVIGPAIAGDWMRAILPWLTSGLLLGRPIVPSISWVWTVVLTFFVVYALINLVLHEPVRASAEVLGKRPFGTFLVGLLTLLLAAPITALLAVSVVGIIVIPFFLCALVVAGVVGRVSVARWIGNSLVAPDDPTSRAQGMRSFVIGFALITLLYIVPVLGFVAWGMVGVFGLGAAVTAFLNAWRKETPPRNGKKTTPPPVEPVPPPVYTPPSSAEPAPAPYTQAYTTPPAATYASPEVVAYASVPHEAYAAATAGAAAATAPPSAIPLARPYASFLERAAAFILDLMLVSVMHEVLEGRLLPYNEEGFLPLLLIYFIAFWAWKGTTVGGIVMKLKVVKVSGAPFEASDAIVRGLAGVLSFAALGIGVLWILRDPERQAWHDKAVGTWVVRESAN